ncbi:glutathione peroxidase [uncultured Brachyspira sp.]|uniref:glutathione peroxidase n=1 Tax=uncultured Brachyspira sp. TaxID=221953 RepID=UPI00261A11F9|nr:glutathione peroxidase [uncultured Brachyspira sp.]
MSIYDYIVKDVNGNDVSISKYKNKVILIVNTATKCGFTNQYIELQELYNLYKDKGFEILDFPCNQFLSQAPGSNNDINNFCKIHYETTFERFSKICVKGCNIEPLYQYLINNSNYILNKNIKWNFTKFLISRNGDIIHRYVPFVKPKNIMNDIEKLL